MKKLRLRNLSKEFVLGYIATEWQNLNFYSARLPSNGGQHLGILALGSQATGSSVQEEEEKGGFE